MKRLAFVLVALVLGLMSLGNGAAAPATLPYGGFGAASGNTLTSNLANNPGNTADDYSGFSFALPQGGIEANQLQELGGELAVLEGNCGGGSPRYSLNIEGGGNVFVYFGDAPSYNNCEDGDVGNLLDSPDARCDYTQVQPGLYGPCSMLEAVLAGRNITGIQLVVDGGWSQAGQVQDLTIVPKVVVDLGNPSSKDACKNGGHVFYGFKNQGQCIQFVNTGK